jgi:hypothetical protein
MKKALLLFSGILLITAFTQAQIGNKVNSQSLIGVWENNDAGYTMTLLIQPDGNGEFEGEQFKYTVTGSKLTLTMQGNMTTTYNYTLANKQLTLSGGDLEQAITFTKSGVSAIPNNNASQETNSITSEKSTSTGIRNSGIEGVWEGYGETIEFMKGGKAIYLGKEVSYSLAGENLNLSAGGQTITLGYQLSGNQLTLKANGQLLVYQKRENNINNSSVSNNSVMHGSIAQELVGKWCYINVTSSSTGGTSTDECITIKADGTYDYYRESSISVNTGDLYGGTASQGNDHGKWRLEGNILHVYSDSQGYHAYPFEKRNHPKNGDPMIVIDGKTFVTYYQKQAW